MSGASDVAGALSPVIAHGWSMATGLSLLAWYVFAPQCLSTLAVVKRETNSWRYPLYMALYLFALAYAGAFLTYRVALMLGDHAAPEAHGVGIAQVLGDLPAPREAAQDQLHGGLADTQPAPRARHEKLRHAVLEARWRGRGCDAHHARKTHRLAALHDHQRKGVRIAEPVCDQVRLAVSHLTEFGKQPGAGIEVIRVITVDALDPQPVGGCPPGTAPADSRGSHRSTALVPRPLNRTGPDSSRVRTVRAVA